MILYYITVNTAVWTNINKKSYKYKSTKWWIQEKTAAIRNTAANCFDILCDKIIQVKIYTTSTYIYIIYTEAHTDWGHLKARRRTAWPSSFRSSYRSCLPPKPLQPKSLSIIYMAHGMMMLMPLTGYFELAMSTSLSCPLLSTALWQHLCEQKATRPHSRQQEQQPMTTKPMIQPIFRRREHDQVAASASNLMNDYQRCMWCADR